MVKSGKFFNFPNKFWELQFEKWPNWKHYFDVVFNLTRQCDHAGLRINVEICGYYAEFQIYDCRHWDSEKNKWCVYEKDKVGNDHLI